MAVDMTDGGGSPVACAVEGSLDEAVVSRLLHHVGARPGAVYGKKGKQHLRQSVTAYNYAAHHEPWFVLVDLDDDAPCAPPMRNQWLPQPAPLMHFRIAVREVESWLLADRDRLAQFLGVPVARVPPDPESLGDPKERMVALAAASQKRVIREGMVPRPASGRRIGPEYTPLLMQFAEDASRGWRPDVAARASDSLARCLRSLRDLPESLP